MTKASRLAAIMQIIDTEGSAQLRDLMDKFQVTDMTIRRDFDQLEADGKIIRVHGGAVPASQESAAGAVLENTKIEPSANSVAGQFPAANADTSSSAPSPISKRLLEPAYVSRLQENLAQKQELAKSCLPLIRQKDFVFLDSGTTTLCIAKELTSDLPCTFITNGINIAAELLTHSMQNVIHIGGEVYLNTWATKGPFAEEQLQTFHADIAFLGCNAISPEGNVMIGNMTETSMKRIAMTVSREIYLVADSGKFDSYSLTAYASVKDFDGIITNRSLPEDTRRRLESLGARFI